MKNSRPMRLARLACLTAPLVLVAACGGGSDPPPPAQAQVGPAGGTVQGPDGVQVVIPAGALAQDVTIGIARSSAGAPRTTPTDYPPASAVYEFTPHGLVFHKPVTIRIPLPAGVASGGPAFMAEGDAGWQYQGATLADGVVSWQRNSFSWGLLAGVCAPQNLAPWSASNPDPYPCAYPQGYTTLAAAAPAAITQLSAADASGSAGSWRVTRAGVLTFTMEYQAAPDCENPRAKLLRWNPMAGTEPQVLFDGSVPLSIATVAPPPGAISGGSTQRGVGSHSVAVTFTEADNAINAAGVHAFAYSFSCNRPGRATQKGGDLLTVLSAIEPAPPPAATSYTVGGSASGVAATGLVLQNNAGDDLAVGGNGGFTFATPVAAGASYAVTVKTQPTGQTCAVANGTGKASANVTNVGVSCVTDPIPTWSTPLAVSAAGVNADTPSLAAAADGGALLAWVEYDAAPESQYNAYASRFTGGAWQPAQSIETLVASSGAGAYSPVAAAANGRNVVVYGFSTQGGTYHTAISRLAGSGWLSQVLDTGSNSHSGTVSLSGDGATAVALYAQHDGSAYSLRSQSVDLASGTFLEQQVTGGTANEPSAVPMPGGDVLAVWGAGSFVLRASRYNGATQSWSPISVLSPGTGTGYPPVLAANASGTAVASWLNLDSGYAVWTARYASGSWGTPVQVAPLTGENQVEDNFDIDLPSTAVGVDASGNAYIAWSQDVTNTRQTAHILVRRCAAAQAMSSCEPAVTLDTSNEWAGIPSMVVAPNGDVWVAWVGIALPSRDLQLRVVRRAAAGGWSAAATVATGLGSDAAPALAVDGLNRVSLAWRGGDQRIYVSRRQ